MRREAVADPLEGWAGVLPVHVPGQVRNDESAPDAGEAVIVGAVILVVLAFLAARLILEALG